MMLKIFKLRQKHDMAKESAEWFHSKWGTPLEFYEKSINQCVEGTASVPQWYIAVIEKEIVGGIGVIENDSYDRKDLTPHICGLYVEEKYRSMGIAGELLDCVALDMKDLGIKTLYLITNHDAFKDYYDWNFLCMVQGDGEPDLTRAYIHEM